MVPNNPKPNNPPPVVTKPVTKPVIPPVEKKDTTRKIITEPIVKPKPKVVIPAPPVIKNRTNELVKVFTVSVPVVTVKLYDNGEIDGDTISVFLDNKLVLASKD